MVAVTCKATHDTLIALADKFQARRTRLSAPLRNSSATAQLGIIATFCSAIVRSISALLLRKLPCTGTRLSPSLPAKRHSLPQLETLTPRQLCLARSSGHAAFRAASSRPARHKGRALKVQVFAPRGANPRARRCGSQDRGPRLPTSRAQRSS